MGVRGRRSKDDFDRADEKPASPRIKPPDYLTKEQCDLWREVVASKPPDWFRNDSAPVLETYVRAVSHYRLISKRLDNAPKDPDVLSKLISCVSQQARLVAQLAQKMRLTQQSRYTPATAGRRDRDMPASQPWND